MPRGMVRCPTEKDNQMKHLLSLLTVCGLGMFAIGCEPGKPAATSSSAPAATNVPAEQKHPESATTDAAAKEAAAKDAAAKDEAAEKAEPAKPADTKPETEKPE